MTKQEEIRERVTQFVEHYAEAMQTEGEQYPEFIAVDNILNYLHSQGVVLKVDEPIYVADVLVACYRVESLIDEVKE